MKAIILILWLFIVCKSNNEQHSLTVVSEDKSPIHLTITSSADTVFLNKPILITARLSNQTSKSILIPSSFTVSSNLFPNGNYIDRILTGGIFTFDIKPTVKFASIYVENLTVSKPMFFKKIKPNKDAVFVIDIGEHINSFNKEINNNQLKVKQGSEYILSLIYANTWTGKDDLFVGTVKSNEVRLFIK